MRKQAKKCVGLLLALSLILSGIQIVPAFVEASTGEESSTETSSMDTTKTWDFDDADWNIEEDFDVTKYSSAQYSLSILDNKLYAKNEGLTSSTEGRFRKAILKEDIALKRISVDIHPEQTTKMLGGGIYLGYADEVTENGGWREDECVFVYLQDSNSSSKYLTLNVYRGAKNDNVKLMSASINGNNEFYDTNDAKALHLEVELEGTSLTVTVSLVDEPSKKYETTIDVSEQYTGKVNNVDNTTVSYDSDILVGRAGLGAYGYGAMFDNFTVTYTEARTWDFNNAEEIDDFVLDKIYDNTKTLNVQTAEHFKIEDGYFCASQEGNPGQYEGRFKKAILEDTNLAVKSVSVDVRSTNNTTVLAGGIYVGYSDTITKSGGWRVDDGVFVSLKDESADDKKIELIVYKATKGASAATTLVKKTVNSDGSFYDSKEAQPMRMTVEVAGPYITVTVRLLDDDTKYFTASADVRVDNSGNETGFTSEVLKGRVGLGAWCEGARFDNFTVNGDTVTVGGIGGSDVAVRRYGTLPTGADVVDGKYILGWTKKIDDAMVAIEKYESVTDTYEANVVDPAMLALSSQTASSETKDGCYDVRFIGSLNEFYNSTTQTFENYKEAGFVFTLDAGSATAEKLVITGENCVTRSTYKLYKGLKETVDSVETTKTPEQIYGSDYAQYLFAYEITGVSIASNKTNRTIYARAYVVVDDGTEDGMIIYGEPSNVTVGEAIPQIDIYLIAGQSNAAGRTLFYEESLKTENSEYVDGFSNVLYSGTAYNMDVCNSIALQEVKAGFGAPNDDGVSGDYMGPEVGMANALSAYYNEESGKTAGIIKFAASAVSLLDDIELGKNEYKGNWVSPSYEKLLANTTTGVQNAEKTGGLYTLFMEQVATSLQQCRDAGYEPIIKGLYWMQGENDRSSCAEYPIAFTYLAQDFRKDLSMLTGQNLNNMPIIIGEISETFDSALADNVATNNAFITMQNTLPNIVAYCYIADISGYAVNYLDANGDSQYCGSDKGHYNEADCLEIGEIVGNLMMVKSGVIGE